jgi:hypothetical protein
MDDLGCILEISTFTASFIADDYTAFGVVLESIYTVFEFLPDPCVCRKLLRKYPYQSICIEEFSRTQQAWHCAP